MSLSNDENFDSTNSRPCVNPLSSEFGISPVSSLSANLGSTLNIRRNSLFPANNDNVLSKIESDKNATMNSGSPTTRGPVHVSPQSGKISESPRKKRPRMMLRQTMSCSPVRNFTVTKQICGRERYPLEDQDPNSQDSGYSNASSTFSEDSKSSSNFRFAEPNSAPPRRTMSTDSPSRDASSPLTKRLATSPRYRKQLLQHRMSIDSISSDLSDEGFGENLMLPSIGSPMEQDENAQLPAGFSALLSGQICGRPMESPDTTNQIPSFHRGLRRSLTDNLATSKAVVRLSVESDFSELVLMESEAPLKRTAPEEDSNIFLKRRKSCRELAKTKATSVESSTFPPSALSGAATAPPATVFRKTLFDYGFQKTSCKKIFQRSFSESAATIAKAIEESTSNPNLIGDYSRSFALPLKVGKHADQRNIDCHTLARLIRGEFTEKISSYTIIDCRYPYEYDAGHIKGAINIYTPEKIRDELIVKKSLRNDAPETADPEKHDILIFHCEFSSERGPSLSRYLRKVDRDNYGVQFPKLDYPEIYLLDGGYSEFYHNYKELCHPCYYQKMIDSKYANEMSQGNKERTLFSRSKSWATTEDSCQSKPRKTTFKRLVL